MRRLHGGTLYWPRSMFADVRDRHCKRARHRTIIEEPLTGISVDLLTQTWLRQLHEYTRADETVRANASVRMECSHNCHYTISLVTYAPAGSTDAAEDARDGARWLLRSDGSVQERSENTGGSGQAS